MERDSGREDWKWQKFELKQSQGSFEDKLSKVQEFGKGYLMQSPQSENYGFAPQHR
ncbi:hypothetical protein M948_07890 [Virgibacillus sp. CM-4]|nr:hypothetical protein M948_07890 [Virgibacillus sp. CM-4]